MSLFPFSLTMPARLGGLLCLLPDAVMAQGQPVDLGSQIPVFLWWIGSGVLGLAIAYGILRNRGRTRAEKQMTESVTRDVYRAEERKG